MNRVHYIHAIDDPTKHGKSLLIRITLCAKIQSRLRSNTDEKLSARGANITTSHRHSTIDVQEPGVFSGFMANRLKRAFCIAETTLDNGDDWAAIVVFRAYGAVEAATVEVATVNEPQKVCRCNRCLLRIYDQFNIAKRRLHEHAHAIWSFCACGGDKKRRDQCQQ